MALEEKTLKCVQCEKEFPFSIKEQEFYAEKGFESDPKRCKSCRVQKKKKQRRNSFGEYRSPAFSDSAPQGRKRGRNNPNGRRNNEYRSPAFKEQQFNAEKEYRAPGFRGQDHLVSEDEYRSPAYKEYSEINPTEEYRAPGFRHDSEQAEQYKDEKPMFSIVCVACNTNAMVPFLPEEKDDPMCQDCYKEHREMLRQEEAEARAEEAAKKAEAEEAEAMDTQTEEPHSADI